MPAADGLRGLAGDLVDIDADRIDGGAQRVAPGGDGAVAVQRRARLARQIGAEAVEIALGLKPDEIIGGEAAHDGVVVGQGAEQLRRRKGRVQEEAERRRHAEPAQLGAQGDEMVVMHPDQIVALQHRRELSREARIDAEIAGEIGAPEIDEVGPIVEQRPQHPVGEAVIILLVILPPEAELGKGDGAGALDHRGLVRRVADFATPAEPDAAIGLERGLDGDGEAAARRCTGRPGGDPVGDDHQPMAGRTHRARARWGRRSAATDGPGVGREKTAHGRPAVVTGLC